MSRPAQSHSQRRRRSGRPAAPPPRRSGRALWALGVAALLALLYAAYVWTAPLREERTLRRASLQDLEAAGSNASDNPRPFYYLGMRLYQLGQTGPSEDAFLSAAKRDSDDQKSWLKAAYLAAAGGDTRKAQSIAGLYVRRHPESAEGHLALARLYQQASSYPGTYAEAQKATQLAPGSAEARRLVGESAAALGKFPEAEKAMRQAVALDPHNWQDQVILGNLLTQRGQIRDATACFQAACGLAPGEALPFLSLGKALLRQATTDADREAAQQPLLRAVQLRPDSGEAHLQLGLCEMQMSHWQDARQDLEQAERLIPADPAVLNSLLAVCQHLGDAEGIVRVKSHQARLADYREQLRRLTQNRPSNAEAPQRLLTLARLCASNGDYEAAALWYQRLLAHFPATAAAQTELTAVQDNEARQTFSLAPSRDPILDTDAAPPTLLLRDAGILQSQGRRAEARAAYTSIIAHYPMSAAAYQGLAQILQAEGNQMQAFALENRAVSLDPRLWQLQLVVADQFISVGLYQQAISHYQAVVKVRPDDARTWQKLGEALANYSDQYLEAEDALQHALSLDPKNLLLLRQTAVVQVERHELDAAEATLRRALALAPDDGEVEAQLGDFLVTNRPSPPNLQEAGRLLQAAQSQLSATPAIQSALGRLALQQGNPQQAIQYLTKAVTGLRGAAAADAWYSLSHAYLVHGDQPRSAAALAHSESIRTLSVTATQTLDKLMADPRNIALNLKLARMYAENDEYAPAINQYQVLLHLYPGYRVAEQELSALEQRLKATGEMPSMSMFNATVAASRSAIPSHAGK